MRKIGLAVLLLAVACAEVTRGHDSNVDNNADDGGAVQDAGTFAILPSDAEMQCGDGQVAEQGKCTQCSKVELTISTKQSCTMTTLNGFTLDGEGFQPDGQNVPQRIFSMDRWGKGHIVAWCDATTLPSLLSAFDVRGYLGQTQNARVASVGARYLCGDQFGYGPYTWIKYQGDDLPAKYKGNPALLAQDWDAIIYCGFYTQWTTDWSKEISAFVTQYGKGFLAAMDYDCPGAGGVTTTDITNMNKITMAAGIQFDSACIAWGTASLSASLSCVPDVPELK